jgi:hypothetical protein
MRVKDPCYAAGIAGFPWHIDIQNKTQTTIVFPCDPTENIPEDLSGIVCDVEFAMQ